MYTFEREASVHGIACGLSQPVSKQSPLPSLHWSERCVACVIETKPSLIERPAPTEHVAVELYRQLLLKIEIAIELAISLPLSRLSKLP